MVTGAPLTYFNNGGGGGGGGVRVIFWGLKFWPNDFLGSIKNAGIFVSREKNRGIFLKGKKD